MRGRSTRRKKKPDKKTVRKILIAAGLFILIAADAYYANRLFYRKYCERMESYIIREVSIETGDPVELRLFFREPVEDSSFVTDVSGIDTSFPATYMLKVRAGRVVDEVILNVADTTPPTATAVPQTIYTGWLPEASECVSVADDGGPVEIGYLEDEPDVSEGGEYLIPVEVTDRYGNSTAVHVPFTVIDDHIAPVISGAQDLEFFIGDNILYREGVTVTDNYDPSPELTIDTSDVNTSEEGLYTVRYIATDEYGNSSEQDITLNLRIMPEGYVDPEIVYAEAREILDSITEPGMSDVEIAFRIFRWTSNNLHYIGTGIKTDWTAGAHEGFTTLRGDCYTYWACAKALLDVAGIPNMCVNRYPAYNSMHFWNLVYLNGEWYHCDSTPSFSHDGYWFMRTDAELDGGHRFDAELDGLPERATESVQSRLDFYNLTLREETT
ncbi:MAG: transglutaminase domain-containing protein [Clostridiales bacterium]|nr:transglutaminase domain-containing protein [Clostridiales bacterium]